MFPFSFLWWFACDICTRWREAWRFSVLWKNARYYYKTLRFQSILPSLILDIGLPVASVYASAVSSDCVSSREDGIGVSLSDILRLIGCLQLGVLFFVSYIRCACTVFTFITRVPLPVTISIAAIRFVATFAWFALCLFATAILLSSSLVSACRDPVVFLSVAQIAALALKLFGPYYL